MKQDVIGLFVGWVMWAAGMLGTLTVLSGCSGIEMGGKLGVYRVDERNDASRTYRAPLPLKCYFTTCAPQGDQAESS